MVTGDLQAISRHVMDALEHGFFSGCLYARLHLGGLILPGCESCVGSITVRRGARVLAHAQPGFPRIFRLESHRGDISHPMRSVTEGLIL